MSSFAGSFVSRIAAAPPVHDEDAADRLLEALGPRAATLPTLAMQMLRAVGGASPYLSRLIERDPDGLFALLEAAPEQRLAALVASTDAAGDIDDAAALARGLRRLKGEAALLAGLDQKSTRLNSSH